MGYVTKVQMIKRKYSRQWFVTLPSALTQAMEIDKGQEVEWIIKNKEEVILKVRKRKRR